MRFKAAISVLAMAMIPFINANDKVLPVKIPSVIISGSNNSCPLQSTIDENLAQSKVQINRIFEDKINQILDQKSTFCGGSFGWTNIASINMTIPNASCPIGLTRSSNLLGCSRVSHSIMTCDSVTYRIGENNYSQVCGRVLGYQIGATDAFRNVYEYYRSSIDQSYMDGVSLTHGPPGSRQHIWTFAAARYEQDTQPRPAWNCRCINPARIGLTRNQPLLAMPISVTLVMRVQIILEIVRYIAKICSGTEKVAVLRVLAVTSIIPHGLEPLYLKQQMMT